MNRLQAIAIVASLAAGGSCGEQDGQDLEGRSLAIINGVPDTDPAHAAVVALTDAPADVFCSGTSISATVVLTAAHCTENTGTHAFEIFFGHDTTSGEGQRRSAIEIAIHPDWNTSTYQGDLSLIRLAEPVPADVAPIPHLPKRLGLGAVDVGRAVDFSGFGLSEEHHSGAKLIAPGRIDVICPPGAIDCAIDGKPVVAGAFAYEQSTGGPCMGDSGGPAFLDRDAQEYVAGVNSYGDPSCVLYGVSTDVSAYAEWIEAFLSDEDCTNEIDDDGDDEVDCVDRHCAAHPACPNACQLAASASCGERFDAETTGGRLHFNAYPCLSRGSWIGPEVAYRLEIPAETTVQAELVAEGDGDLDLFLVPATQNGCDPFGCIAGSWEQGQLERLVFDMPSTDAYLVVETYDRPSAFELQITCNPVESCDNEVDDDGDGWTDCRDPDCTEDIACQAEACDNGLDDDGDDRIDCADSDCSADPLCSVKPEDCENALDDDLDGQSDCSDPDCSDHPACHTVDDCGCGSSRQSANWPWAGVLLFVCWKLRRPMGPMGRGAAGRWRQPPP